MHGLNTKKIWSGRTHTTEYISVLLSPGCWHHIFASKKENGVCLMQISSATEIAVELNRAYDTSTPIFKIINFIQQNISRWYLVFYLYGIFEQMAFFFSSIRLLWKWKNMQCFRQWLKEKKLNWWLTCIQFTCIA